MFLRLWIKDNRLTFYRHSSNNPLVKVKRVKVKRQHTYFGPFKVLT